VISDELDYMVSPRTQRAKITFLKAFNSTQPIMVCERWRKKDPLCTCRFCAAMAMLEVAP
jgi:hypothetical protein